MLSQPLHTFKTSDTFVGMTVEGGNLVISETRNEEQAAEGRFNSLLTVIPLQEAIAAAKALLAAQKEADEDAWIEEMYQRHQDRFALEDDALEHDYEWIRQGC